MSKKRPRARFMQIAVATTNWRIHLYALDEDGRVWHRSGGAATWTLVTGRRSWA